MTRTVGLLLAAGLTLASGAARADADDRKWIAQCMRDNSNARVSTSVVQKYCTA
jgi:hypothetical protein